MVEPDRVREGERQARGVPPATLGPARATDARRRLDDLHDGVIQTLFGVGLTLEAAAATAGEEALAVRLEEAAGNLAGVVRDLREYAGAHQVDRIDPGELEPTIRALVQELAVAGGVRFSVQTDPAAAVALAGAGYPLIEMVAALLAGLARRHRTGRGAIRLRRGRRWVRLDVTTEGTGGRPAPAWSRHERLQLRARAARLDWRLVFGAEAGPAARATVRVPMPA